MKNSLTLPLGSSRIRSQVCTHKRIQHGILTSWVGGAEYSLNNYATRLAHTVYPELNGREVVPDLSGSLRILEDVSIPPDLGIGDQKSAESILDLWAGYEHRPQNWLHRSAVTTNRLATIARIYHRSGVQSSVPPNVDPSMARGANGCRGRGWRRGAGIGHGNPDSCVPPGERSHAKRSGCKLCSPRPTGGLTRSATTVYLGDGLGSTPPTRVHPEIESDQKNSRCPQEARCNAAYSREQNQKLGLRNA